VECILNYRLRKDGRGGKRNHECEEGSVNAAHLWESCSRRPCVVSGLLVEQQKRGKMTRRLANRNRQKRKKVRKESDASSDRKNSRESGYRPKKVRRLSREKYQPHTRLVGKPKGGRNWTPGGRTIQAGHKGNDGSRDFKLKRGSLFAPSGGHGQREGSTGPCRKKRKEKTRNQKSAKQKGVGWLEHPAC